MATTDTKPTADEIAALTIIDFSSKRLNFANTATEIAQQALAAGVSAEEIIEIFVDRIDEGDIDRLLDDVVAGGMKFDPIEVTIDTTNISAFVDDHTSLIDKPKMIRSAFWWACMAHLRISA